MQMWCWSTWTHHSLTMVTGEHLPIHTAIGLGACASRPDRPPITEREQARMTDIKKSNSWKNIEIQSCLSHGFKTKDNIIADRSGRLTWRCFPSSCFPLPEVDEHQIVPSELNDSYWFLGKELSGVGDKLCNIRWVHMRHLKGHKRYVSEDELFGKTWYWK